MTTKPGLKSTIEYYHLGEAVADMLFKDKLSYKDITKKLKEQYNVDLTIACICNFKKYIMDSIPDFLEQKKEYKEALSKKYLDTVDNLLYAINQLKAKIEEFQKDPKLWRQHSTYMGLYLAEINLLLKRAGEIRPMQIIDKQQINMIQINQIVSDEISRLIEEKKIDLNSCAPEIKDFYWKWKKNANTGRNTEGNRSA